MAILRDNTTPANTLKVNADGSINTTVAFPTAGLEIANDVGNPIPVSGSVSVGNFPATQASNLTQVNGAAHSATNPLFADVTDRAGRALGAISGTVTANQGNAGASAWPVNANQSGTWSVTANAGTGTFNIAGTVGVNNFPATQSVNLSQIGGVAPSVTNPLYAVFPPSVVATTTGAAAAAATLTIPAAPAGQFIYVTGISILLVNTAARAAAAATLITVTTTGITGAPTFNYGSPVTTVGSIDATYANINFTSPVKGTAAATAATIVGPATTGVQWVIRANFYYAP